MSTSTTLLALLESGPSHGYTLKQRYDEHFAQRRPLAFGQVYATLGRLERSGLAADAGSETGSGPERRRYRITPDGVEAVDEFVLTPQDPDLFAASTLYTRVTLALLSGRDADDVLHRQRERHLGRMRELQARRRSSSGAELLSVTYELTHLDADLRWIEDSGRRLDAVRADLLADPTDAGADGADR